jgi:ATP-binding cassette, subfamily B, multidrug efflux pump
MKDFKDNTRERSDKEVLRRLISYMKPFKKEFIIIFILLIIGLSVQLIPPLLIGLTVDTVASEVLLRNEKIIYIITINVIFIVSLVIGNTVQYIQSVMLQKVGQKTVVNLRDEVFNHIENLSIGQINQVPVGKLVTRVTNDTNAISEMYTNIALNLVRNF